MQMIKLLKKLKERALQQLQIIMFIGGNMFVNVTWKKEHHIFPLTFWNLHNKEDSRLNFHLSITI